MTVADKLPALLDAQIEQAKKWILSGASAFDVADAIRASFPDADPPKLILAAMQRFREAANFDVEIVRGWVFEAARDLYRRMVESGDYAGALRAIKEIQGMTPYVHDDGEAAPEGEIKQLPSGPTPP